MSQVGYTRFTQNEIPRRADRKMMPSARSLEALSMSDSCYFGAGWRPFPCETIDSLSHISEVEDIFKIGTRDSVGILRDC
jgi:hypothetical protein